MKTHGLTLKGYKELYKQIVEKREEELYLPEERKTLKTRTFIAMEKEIVRICDWFRKHS